MTMLARADDLVLYGAGCLREAMAQIATTFNSAHGVTVTTQLSPCGRMRECIEKGEHVDVFTSADIGHARKLVQDGWASVMAMFTCNTAWCMDRVTGAKMWAWLHFLLAPARLAAILCGRAAAPDPFWA